MQRCEYLFDSAFEIDWNISNIVICHCLGHFCVYTVAATILKAKCFYDGSKHKSNAGHRNKHMLVTQLFANAVQCLSMCASLCSIYRQTVRPWLFYYENVHGLLCLFSNPLFVQADFFVAAAVYNVVVVVVRVCFFVFLVRIYLPYEYKFCAGSIIANNWIKFNIIFNIM